MSISDREVSPKLPMGMQEIIRMFNKEYNNIIRFTINTDYSQNEIYQICALMNSVVIKFGTQNYTLNGYLNDLTYYLLNTTKPCSNIDEYEAHLTLYINGDLDDIPPQ